MHPPCRRGHRAELLGRRSRSAPSLTSFMMLSASHLADGTGFVPAALLRDNDGVNPARSHRPVTTASAELFARAHAVTPGGVNSPVRAFNAVGGTPRFIESARGAYLRDVDGNEYVDLVCSWGPMLLGHAHRDV